MLGRRPVPRLACLQRTSRARSDTVAGRIPTGPIRFESIPRVPSIPDRRNSPPGARECRAYGRLRFALQARRFRRGYSAQFQGRRQAGLKKEAAILERGSETIAPASVFRGKRRALLVCTSVRICFTRAILARVRTRTFRCDSARAPRALRAATRSTPARVNPRQSQSQTVTPRCRALGNACHRQCVERVDSHWRARGRIFSLNPSTRRRCDSEADCGCL